MTPLVQAEKLSRINIVLESAYQAANAADYSQTIKISRSCKDGVVYNNTRFQEANPFIGPCPSQRTVKLYFATMGLGHYYITKNVFTGDARILWQGITLLRSVRAVLHNKRAGLSVDF
jgi:hypothetical protein